MKVECTLAVYELDGVRWGRSGKPPSTLIVRAHRIDNGVSGLVVVEIDGHSYSVATQDLKEAINRCSGFPP